MRQVVSDVYLIEGLRIAQVYALTSEKGLTLVDTGSPGEAGQIAAQLEEGGYALSDVQAIVLTHCHSDHVGGAAELARHSGAQILAHRDDAPYIEQTESLQSNSFSQWLLAGLLGSLFKTDPCKVDRRLQNGDVIEVLGGLRVLHLPGHTPGNITLYQPERRLLFSGDTVLNLNLFGSQARLRRPPRILSVDQVQAEESARKLAGMLIDVLCTGHGEPIFERAEEKIRKALM